MQVSARSRGFWPNRRDWTEARGSMGRGSVLGFLLGATPGAGATVASLMSYSVEKAVSKTPEKFGKGAVPGLVGPEAANNGASAGSMVPLLTLGVPGSGATAVLLGGFLIWGLQPGPLLMEQNPDFAWGLIGSMYLGNVMLLVLNIFCVPVFASIARVPFRILGPIVIVLCVVGAYMVNGSLVEVGIMLACGVLGFFMRRYGFSPAALVIALVLGPMAEESLRQTLIISGGSFDIFLQRGMSQILLLFIAFLCVMAFVAPSVFRAGRRALEARAERRAAEREGESVEGSGSRSEDERPPGREMTQTPSPQLMVLDDWEGLVGAAPATTRLRERCSVTVLDRPVAEVPDRDLAEVRFLLAIRERTLLDAPTLARFPCLELVLQTGSHAYHADPDALRRRRILVALGRGGRAVRAAVPELTLLLILACMRRIGEASRGMLSGDWPSLPGRVLAGRRLGVLGLGRHGLRVARLAAAFDMEVLAWDRVGEQAGRATADGRIGPEGVRLLPLSPLLATSDVVSVHLRLSRESRGLLGPQQLCAMKPGSVLVNTARGALVDELALVEALREGSLAAAGLDVFADEPLPAEHPLRSLPNAVLTPHVGWTVEEVFAESAEIAADQLDAYLAGRLDPSELLDVDVEPAEGALGGVLEASAR